MRQVKCDRKCQSNRDGFCIGMPCFLGKEVEDHKTQEKLYMELHKASDSVGIKEG
jgi:hypothetical protein